MLPEPIVHFLFYLAAQIWPTNCVQRQFLLLQTVVHLSRSCAIKLLLVGESVNWRRPVSRAKEQVDEERELVFSMRRARSFGSQTSASSLQTQPASPSSYLRIDKIAALAA